MSDEPPADRADPRGNIDERSSDVPGCGRTARR